MLNLMVIGSSSRGNCYLLYAGIEILILECGVNYKKILEGLHYKLSDVKGCLVTHEHQDHSKAIKDILKAGISVYSGAGTFGALGISHHNVKPIKAKEQFTVGGFTVLPFDTEHDCEEPLGYLIQHIEFGTLLFATDTYYIKYKFPGLNYIMIECNYSREIVINNIENGYLSPALRNRLLHSHFSLENVKKFLDANDLTQVHEILLMHLSDGNSNASQFKTEIERQTGVPVKILA